jgi:transcriptional regulator of acetoin/glycerol metabolism
MVRHQSRVLSLASFRSAIGDQLSAADGGEKSCADEEANLFAACRTLPTLKESNNLLIEESLRRSQGNQDAAARLIGLTRTALNRRLNRNP